MVNIKLKQHFTGVEIDAQGGGTSRGDGASDDFTIIAGSDFAEDRGNAYIGLDYSSRNSVVSDTRPYLVGWGLSTNLPSGNVQLAAGNLPSQAAVNSIFAKYGVAPGTVPVKSSLLLSTNQNGTLFTQQNAINYLGPTGDPARSCDQGRPVRRFGGAGWPSDLGSRLLVRSAADGSVQSDKSRRLQTQRERLIVRRRSVHALHHRGAVQSRRYWFVLLHPDLGADEQSVHTGGPGEHPGFASQADSEFQHYAGDVHLRAA